MTGSALGGLKLGAYRLGISLAEYGRHRLLGEQWCHLCRRWLPESEFRRPQGRIYRQGQCRACFRTYMRLYMRTYRRREATG